MIYDMIWYNVIYDMIYDMLWYGMICDMIWYNLIWFDLLWCDIYDKIYDMICLIAIEFSPGGSSTVHIYTQTIHRTIQWTQTIHRTIQFTN